ncbi:hypothetical protein C8Q80DRAFT_1222772 [Daedaleopsis nitida]|nr:hypothetical protein C8Q80DRAFT_1222772 [Daedaleopsis nitida]
MFQFVPRKVAQKSAKPSTLPPPNSSSNDTPSSTTRPPENLPEAKHKGKANQISLRDEDIAAALWLSISDYTLWANVDLRRAVANADEGWIPLSYLVRQSSHLVHLGSTPSDASLARAIRGHADSLLEVRMLVTSPSKAQGGYEIRRKDWGDALVRVRNSTRNEWETRTVYMESIPLSHRSLAGVYHFASSILPPAEGVPSVQSITLPPHHLDRPGDVPKCKGFALVVLADIEDATRLVAEWPWSPRRSPSSHPGQDSPDTVRDALKFGFRTLRKSRWDELKEEYLTYRQQLLDDIAGTSLPPTNGTRQPEDEEGPIITESEISHWTGHKGAGDAEDRTESTPSSLDPSAPFPPGCLVFVRNVHPETNKTTLKTLFTARAFGTDAGFSSSSVAIDYVDYNKGMTSCHLRLSTAHLAQTLVSAVQTEPVVQRGGLDTAGTAPSGGADAGAKPISAEVVDGEREALYWNKVPEKVRREAVRRAIEHTQSQRGGSADPDVVGDAGDGAKRPRKRRRKA